MKKLPVAGFGINSPRSSRPHGTAFDKLRLGQCLPFVLLAPAHVVRPAHDAVSDSILEQVLSAFVEAIEATNAPASAYAAAAILAMEVNSRELHHKYREMLLKKELELKEGRNQILFTQYAPNKGVSINILVLSRWL